MLIGSTRSVRGRIFIILASIVAITIAVILAAAVGAWLGSWDWPPRPSSVFGVTLGLIAAVIILFEMSLLLRKRLRGKRLGATRVWMRWHIWLGIVSLPIVILHAGFALGGPVTTITLSLFLAVIVSGVWGLVVQQWLPQKLLAGSANETIVAQLDFLGDGHAAEATRIVDALVTVPPGAEIAEPLVAGTPAVELETFNSNLLVPYLRSGLRSKSPLASRTEANQRFARLRDTVPDDARTALDRLQELAELRRQWDAQARIHFWLHNWVLVHVPLSVAMTVLMVLHALRALKYW